MATADGLTAREAKRLQTRERLLGSAIAEFTRAGMAEADVAAIVSAAGVAHGTFFFHFPTKEHVLYELERREEERMAKQFRQFVNKNPDLASALRESVRLVAGLERRLGPLLFKDFLGLHFSPSRPPAEEGTDHPLIMLVAEVIERARKDGSVEKGVNSINSAVFFLLGLYALLITTDDSPSSRTMLDDFVHRSLRSLGHRG